MYIKNPGEIEKKSFEIIRGNMESPDSFSEDELKVVMRTIHTTGDYGYENIVKIQNGAIASGVELLKSGCRIVTDTKMALAGINKKTLESLGCRIENFIDRPEVYKAAQDREITRSMAAMDMAVEDGVDIFVIGNAPTALYRIGEHLESGHTSPGLIIGAPVGFVGAAESKEYIREFDVPSITTEGFKGGSNVAAAILNALMYMVKRA